MGNKEMSDQPNQPRSLSEISHLFLSSVRDKATQGQPRPMRIPPARKTDASVELSPEEMAEVFGEPETAPQLEMAPVGPVRAILASHLGTQQLARVQEYAAHRCAGGRRVGLLAVDASEFRLSLFEHNPNPQPHAAATHDADSLDGRKMSEALAELAWDVDEWLLLLPTPRVPEARSILRDVTHWTILSSADHEGIVSCYRTLKGLSDLHHPRLSLATLDAQGDADAASAFSRLSSVCRQFLGWPLENDGRVTGKRDVSEHVVLWCSGMRDKAQLAAAPQWQVVTDFIARARIAPAPAPQPALEPPSISAMPVEPAPVVAAAMPPASKDVSDVIELPQDHTDPESIVSAVLKGGHELVECPIKPPMCPEAKLAVARDHRLVIVAVARQGLSDLKAIGQAYQWMIENRALFAMAVPPMSIDAHALPRLHLLVDHVDMSAAVMQPIMQSASVIVSAYRKLRWAGRTGLLLEAA